MSHLLGLSLVPLTFWGFQPSFMGFLETAGLVDRVEGIVRSVQKACLESGSLAILQSGGNELFVPSHCNERLATEQVRGQTTPCTKSSGLVPPKIGAQPVQSWADFLSRLTARAVEVPGPLGPWKTKGRSGDTCHFAQGQPAVRRGRVPCLLLARLVDFSRT